MLNIKNPLQYLKSLITHSIVWVILVVVFPFYLIGYLIIKITSK